MEEFSMPQSILQIVSEKGFDGLREIMQMLFNEAMKTERENYLHASPYQRTDLRTDHANGFKSRASNTLQDKIQLVIPQTRNGVFYPSCLEKGMHSELGVSVELSEVEVHWRKFVESLIARGLHVLKLIVSDNHVGLKAARMSVFPSVPWQRCQFHLQQNATAHIPRKSMQQDVHNDIRGVSICRHGPMLKSS